MNLAWVSDFFSPLLQYTIPWNCHQMHLCTPLPPSPSSTYLKLPYDHKKHPFRVFKTIYYFKHEVQILI